MTWSAMSPAEKREAATAATRTMTYREAAASLGTTKGAIAAALFAVNHASDAPRTRGVVAEHTPSPLTRERLEDFAARVGRVFHVSPRLILAGDRGLLASMGRHVTMYLMLQLPRPACRETATGWRKTKPHDRGLTELAKLSGFDHTAIWHSANVVEDLRDDPPFDAAISALERDLGLA